MMDTPKKNVSLALIAILLSGCVPNDPVASPEVTVELLGEGYRYKGDVCRIVGESPLTSDLLDDSYDLVGCPDDIALEGNMDGVQELRHIQGYRIFSVPQR